MSRDGLNQRENNVNAKIMQNVRVSISRHDFFFIRVLFPHFIFAILDARCHPAGMIFFRLIETSELRLLRSELNARWNFL